MSCYVVTRRGEVVEYPPSRGDQVWLGLNREPGIHKIYGLSCACCDDQKRNCKPPHTKQHENLIAWVSQADILSIGFEKPTIVAGMPIQDLTILNHFLDSKWLMRLPKKLAGVKDAIRRAVGRRA